ncbi:helix-turn-helix domain-containing protein [Terrisporobacter sp.]
MDQKRVGMFLKTLRKEKNITQEQLAEKLNVSGRTVSRWETGVNMPDISLLVELAEFYEISIPEIIDGERKSEEMKEETKNTAIKMAEYSKNEVVAGKRKIASILLSVFGILVILSALAIFPNDSSWGSIYAILGGIILTIGVYLASKLIFAKRVSRLSCILGCIVVLFSFFLISDYVAVSQFNQVPRFCYEKIYSGDDKCDRVECKTLFYSVIWENPGTEYENVRIVK